MGLVGHAKWELLLYVEEKRYIIYDCLEGGRLDWTARFMVVSIIADL